MCSNLPPPPAPPISNRDLPTANGPWDWIRLGFFEDAELVERRSTGRLRSGVVKRGV